MFDTKTLMEKAKTGYSLVEFQSSEVGKYLNKKAATEIRAALYELKDADPTDAKGIQSIQNRIKVAESFQTWIADGIFEAEQAERQLHEEFEDFQPSYNSENGEQ